MVVEPVGDRNQMVQQKLVRSDRIVEEPEPARSQARGEVLQAGGSPADLKRHLKALEAFYDAYAIEVDEWHRRNGGYHRAIASLAQYYIPPGQRVLEVGSGNGDLLAAVQPADGVGVDISSAMVRRASEKYPQLRFQRMSAEEFDLPGESFDVIILSDLVGYLYDIRQVLERIRTVCHGRTRIVLHWYSRLWQPVLAAAEQLGMKRAQPLINWTTVDDIANLFYLAGFEVVHRRQHILLPIRVPWLTRLANRYLAHLPGLRWLCLTNWVVARPLGVQPPAGIPRVSVICPCRNEAGTIEGIARRLPQMGVHTELIFVEGHSKDDTLAQCQQVISKMPERDIKVVVQQGVGKGDAVRLGFAEANGDIFMILDADVGVAPEDLPQFYDALVSGKGELVNGSRLVYVVEKRAMRFLNLFGNRCFAWLLSGLLGQPIKDALCGTKVLWRDDYERIAANRAYFGPLDPFGDFDLLFGAAKLNLKIIDVPIRYRERLYGATNIKRFTDGWLLLRLSAKAAARLWFVG